MPNDALIICGGKKPGARKKQWREAKQIHLDVQDNVNLDIQDISRPLAANLTEVELDLLEIATYVYVADQAVSRGGSIEIDYGEAWHRNFRFEVPVRDPDFWKSEPVRSSLIDCLSYLSGDDYEFEFVKAKRPATHERYLNFRGTSDQEPQVDDVVLFSGGLDSLSGAVQEILGSRRRVSLVSHRPSSKLDSRQKALVRQIRQAAGDARLQPEHIRIKVNKAKSLNKEYTQRSRSFIYAALASVTARVHGLKGIKFFENGVVSINLPLADQVTGTHATRTTHPQTLRRFERFFSAIYGIDFEVKNPFIWKTKAEVIRQIEAAGHAELIPLSVSCAHTWVSTTDHPHCGRCSQCLDRRLTTIAAGTNGALEGPAGYKFDVLMDPIEEEDFRALSERYLGKAHEYIRTASPKQFLANNGEAAAVLNHVDVKPDIAAEKVFELHKRHGEEVVSSIQQAVEHYSEPIARRSVSPDCLLAMATNVSERTSSSEIESELTTPSRNAGHASQVTLSRDSRSVSNGRNTLELGPTKEFDVLEVLFNRKGVWIGFDELMKSAWGEQVVTKNAVTKQVGNLRRDLKKEGIEQIHILAENNNFKLVLT